MDWCRAETFEVCACVDDEGCVERPEKEEDAKFFGVYACLPDGMSHWVADCDTKEPALKLKGRLEKAYALEQLALDLACITKYETHLSENRVRFEQLIERARQLLKDDVRSCPWCGHFVFKTVPRNNNICPECGVRFVDEQASSKGDTV